MNDFQVAEVIQTRVYTEMPVEFRKAGVQTEWSLANRGGTPVDSFIEGPIFDPAGNLYVVDIPHGRIFRISPQREWRLIAEYDGEPNGMVWHPDGYILIADYKNGIMRLDPAEGVVSPFLIRRNTERFKGPNDLILARNGDLYFTDQGQTGLHDPTGRVYRRQPNGRLDCLLGNGPSPNGLVLNGAENVLFVAMTRDNAVWRMPLQTDGSVSKVGRFAQFYGPGGPDGMKMDAEGNLFVCHSSLGTIFVLSPQGENIARIKACRGHMTTNFTFGGPERKTLFITESSTGTVLTADWPVAGAHTT